MHQYRRAAKRGLWDAEINRATEDDGNTNYNPFFSRVTRANRRLDVTSNDTDGPQSKLDPPLGLRQDEADLEPHFTRLEVGKKPVKLGSDATPAHVVSSHKPPLRRKFGTRGKDKAIRKFAEIGLALVEHGPLGTTGPFLLNPLAHQRSIILVEYGSRNPLVLGK